MGAPRSVLRKESPRHFQFTDLFSQISELKSAYPYLKTDPVVEFVQQGRWSADTLPEGADGWVAVPRAHKVCEHYFTAVTTVLRRLTITYGNTFRDHTYGIPYDVRRTDHTSRCLALMRQKQPDDVLVLAVQLGGKYIDLSAKDAQESFDSNEFGLGLFEVANILMTNQGRLSSPVDLGIEACGDRYTPESTPCFNFHNRSLELKERLIDIAEPNFGAATAFLVP